MKSRTGTRLILSKKKEVASGEGQGTQKMLYLVVGVAPVEGVWSSDGETSWEEETATQDRR